MYVSAKSQSPTLPYPSFKYAVWQITNSNSHSNITVTSIHKHLNSSLLWDSVTNVGHWKGGGWRYSCGVFIWGIKMFFSSWGLRDKAVSEGPGEVFFFHSHSQRWRLGAEGATIVSAVTLKHFKHTLSARQRRAGCLSHSERAITQPDNTDRHGSRLSGTSEHRLYNSLARRTGAAASQVVLFPFVPFKIPSQRWAEHGVDSNWSRRYAILVASPDRNWSLLIHSCGRQRKSSQGDALIHTALGNIWMHDEMQELSKGPLETEED